ncbi:MAG: glutathione peroxidase, partial [Candidatus Glassbacteria bacterium]
MSFFIRILALTAIAALAAGGAQAGPAKQNYPLAYTMNDIEGKPVDLAGYRGRVILLVNTASKCGLTP